MTSPFPQITSPPQAAAEVVVNEALDTLSHQAVYGKSHATTSGLIWGWYGGRWGGFAIADETVTLGASSTTYLVVAIGTGVLSASTATTNWNDATNYVRAYKLTTSATAITAEEDHRAGPGGVHGGGGGGGGGFTGMPVTFQLALSDLATAIATGTNVGYFDAPFDFTITEAIATVLTASSSALPQFNVKKNGTTIFSTNLTIDATEVSSLTAATQPVISVTAVAKGDRITWDIVAAGTGAKGAQGTVNGLRS